MLSHKAEKKEPEKIAEEKTEKPKEVKPGAKAKATKTEDEAKKLHEARE